MSASVARLLPGAEPFELEGDGSIGALLVHGFTGSPAEMRDLGEALAVDGVGSGAPLLRGHGTHPNDMLEYRYVDWIADVEAGLDHLLERHERAVLVGLSMGGTLALNVAARRSHDPRLIGIVAMCAPLVLDDWRLPFVRLASPLLRWRSWGEPDILDRSAWDRHVGYRRFRTRAIAELADLMRETHQRLPAIRQPVLLVQAREDHVVPPRNLEVIRSGLGSAHKEILILDNCYHIVTLDFAARQLEAEVVRFVRHLAATHSSA